MERFKPESIYPYKEYKRYLQQQITEDEQQIPNLKGYDAVECYKGIEQARKIIDGVNGTQFWFQLMDFLECGEKPHVMFASESAIREAQKMLDSAIAIKGSAAYCIYIEFAKEYGLGRYTKKENGHDKNAD